MRRVFFGLAISLAAFAPSWARGDDQQIAQSIVQELKAHQTEGKLRGFKIDLQVEDGTVLLTGRVSDNDQQKLAVQIAESVEGVKQVVNDLEIATRPATSTQESPRRFPLSNLNPLKLLGNKSEEKVAEEAPTPAPRLAQKPIVEQQDVVIPPPVHIQAEPIPAKPAPAPAPIAATPVAPVAPVQQLQSSDEQIAQEVYRRLQQVKADGRLQGFRLDMRVEDGSVLLDGHVSSPDQKQLTLEIARRVPGVYQVVDMIHVDVPQVLPASIADTSNRRTTPAPVAAAPAAPATLQPTPAQPIMAQPQMAYYVAQPQALGLQQAMPIPAHYASTAGIAQVRYDHPQMPGYAWPSYAAYPNYAGVTYPKQYSPAAWPYIGPFYPYPQVPLGWRKVTLQWHDGWWFLDFKER